MSSSYPPADTFRRSARLRSEADYEAMYRRSIDDSEAFWREQAERLHWFAPFDRVRDVSYDPNDIHIKWYVGGKTNACYNALDRHVEDGLGERTAFIVEPDAPEGEVRRLSYADVHREVQRLANVLKDLGVEKGDRVTIYLPMIPEAVYSLLACARIGAVFSVVFAGFSPDSLSNRILDGESDFVITADTGRRGGRTVALKANVDTAVARAEAEGQAVRHVLVVRHTSDEVEWDAGRDVWLQVDGGISRDTVAEAVSLAGNSGRGLGAVR